MEHTEDDKLGNIYKKAFGNETSAVDDSDWILYQSKLNKFRFYKFAPFQFNIYYLLFIAGALIFSAAVFMDYFFISGKENSIISVKKNITSEIRIEKQDPPDPKVKNTPGAQQQRPGKEVKSHSSQTAKVTPSKIIAGPLSPPEVTQIIISKDSISSENNKKMAVSQKRNTVYITKQDTIIVVDTVKTKKKRVFFK